MRKFLERAQHRAWHTASSEWMVAYATVTIRMIVEFMDTPNLVLCKKYTFFTVPMDQAQKWILSEASKNSYFKHKRQKLYCPYPLLTKQ